MDSETFVRPVLRFADTVIERGRDRYGDADTPLFADAIDATTLDGSTYDARNVKNKPEPDWKFPGDGDRPQPNADAILCNVATQGNFFRTLVGLSRATGDETYRERAEAAVRHAFDQLTDSRGLFYWGGHTAYDLRTDSVTYAVNKGKVHELKMDYPYYELLWAVDPEATRRFVAAFWNAHVLDWSRVHFNRHGAYDDDWRGDPWDHDYDGAEVFYEDEGYTLKNTGSDLQYAAGMLAAFTGEAAPLHWAKRLGRQYVTTRQPGTGISGYQYNVSTNTTSEVDGVVGDRAYRHFGQYVPEGHLVNAGTLFKPRPTVQRRHLRLGKRLGDRGREFTQWAREELRAWGEVAYRPEDNTFEPMLTDGYSLEGFVIRDDGYFGPEGREIVGFPATPAFFWTYALGYRTTGDESLWQTARAIARGNGLGDVGTPAGTDVSIRRDTELANSAALNGLLELYRATGREAYLELASVVGENLLAEQYRDGLFVLEDDVALLGNSVPLSLLDLGVALDGDDVTVPAVGDRPDGRRFSPYDSGAYP